MTTTETTEQAPAAAPPPARRRLERSRDDRVVAGVCGGLARYFDVDVTLVRVAAIVSIAFGGVGALAYVIAVLLVPDQGSDQPVISGGPERRRGIALLAAAALGVIVLFILGTWGDVAFGVGPGWPLVLLAAGGALVWFLHARDDGPAHRPSAAAGSYRTGGGDAPVAGGAGSVATPADPAEAETEVGGSGAGGAGAPGGPGGDDPTTAYPTAVAEPPEPPEPAPARDRGSWAVTAFAGGGVLLALGAAGVLDATDVVDLGWGAIVAIGVILTGVALVVSAWFGGARGLIPLGIVLALALGTTAAAGVTLDGGIGEETYRIQDAALMDGSYELALGHLVLDLRDVELPPGETRVDADVDVGQLEIVAPGASVEGGDVDRRSPSVRESSGLDVNRTIVIERGADRLVIDGHTGIGVITVSDGPFAADWEREWSSAPPARCAPLSFALVRTCGGDDDAA